MTQSDKAKTESNNSSDDDTAKSLKLGPSCYRFSCLCGHGQQVRDFAVRHSNKKCPQVTIRPKIPPVPIEFQ